MPPTPITLEPSKPSKSYEVTPSPTGHNLIATRPIPRGTPILKEPALLTVTHSSDYSDARPVQLALQDLSAETAARLSALKPSNKYGDSLESRYRNNCIVVDGVYPFDDDDEKDNHDDKHDEVRVKERGCTTAVFEDSSRADHSCLPNAIFNNDKRESAAGDEDGRGGMIYAARLRATRDIRPGEEICITYLQDTRWMPRERRRELLRESWGFECRCGVCVEPAGEEYSREGHRALLRETLGDVEGAREGADERDAEEEMVEREFGQVRARVDAFFQGDEDGCGVVAAAKRSIAGHQIWREMPRKAVGICERYVREVERELDVPLGEGVPPLVNGIGEVALDEERKPSDLPANLDMAALNAYSTLTTLYTRCGDCYGYVCAHDKLARASLILLGTEFEYWKDSLRDCGSYIERVNLQKQRLDERVRTIERLVSDVEVESEGLLPEDPSIANGLEEMRDHGPKQWTAKSEGKVRGIGRPAEKILESNGHSR